MVSLIAKVKYKYQKGVISVFNSRQNWTVDERVQWIIWE